VNKEPDKLTSSKSSHSILLRWHRWSLDCIT